MAITLPDIRRVWQPDGHFGYVTDADSVVTAVERNTPAEKAGLKVGDRIDLASTNPDYRTLVVGDPGTSLPGQRVLVAVRQGAQERYVSMTSQPETMDIAKKAFILGRELAMLLFVGPGATLVLLRPAITTWAFYFFCLGFQPSPDILMAAYANGPPWNLVANGIGWTIWQAGIVGVVVFAALFLREQSGGCAPAPISGPVSPMIFLG